MNLTILTKRSLPLLFLILGASVFGQKIRVIEGETSVLKGLKSIATEISFENLLVGAEVPEATFIQMRKEQWEQKESGKGDAWEKHWTDSKANLYGPAFGYVFGKNSGLTISKDAPYTLILKTTQIEPGWNGGPMGGPAFIIGDVWIVDSTDRSRVIAKISLQKMKGKDRSGGDFEMGRRIQEAYVNAATSLGLYFKEKLM